MYTHNSTFYSGSHIKLTIVAKTTKYSLMVLPKQNLQIPVNATAMPIPKKIHCISLYLSMCFLSSDSLKTSRSKLSLKVDSATEETFETAKQSAW